MVRRRFAQTGYDLIWELAGVHQKLAVRAVPAAVSTCLFNIGAPPQKELTCLDLQPRALVIRRRVYMYDERRLCREVLEYVANTLIFVLSGVIISSRVHTSSQGQGAIVHALDYAYALLLWVYLLVRPLRPALQQRP